MDTQFFIITLASVLLMPLVPAFLLYKFLPSKTNVAGPFKGLNLKLTGAFAGYFLLVLAALGVFFYMLKNEQAKTIKELEQKLSTAEQAGSSRENWKMYGVVASTSPRETSMYFDKSGAQFELTGEFELPFTVSKENGKAVLPKSVSIYNNRDGYRVLNISRDFPERSDIPVLDIKFDDSAKKIYVGKVINIQTKEDDRVKTETNIIEKIKTGQINVATYQPVKPVYVKPELLQPKIKIPPGIIDTGKKFHTVVDPPHTGVTTPVTRNPVYVKADTSRLHSIKNPAKPAQVRFRPNLP